MKKRVNVGLKKACALLLVLVMVLGYIPSGVLTVRAEDAAHNNLAVKVADPDTVNAWKNQFSANRTEYAGGVWTDKSVFEDAADYIAATDEKDDAHAAALKLSDSDNFLVSLSAIASTKRVEGYENLPSDTMLVLDLSGSMSHENMRAMINATNSAINRLLELNKHNRVGVVLYSGNHDFGSSEEGSATVILPLGRYTTTATTTVNQVRIPAYLTYTGSGNENGTVAIAATGSGYNRRVLVKDPDGNTLNYAYKSAQGGTYIQNGLYKAMMQFTDADNNPEVESGIQAGTTRIPIMVLMSDGAPSAATTNYDGNQNGIGTSDIGDGGSNTNDMAFLTQLTSVYAKYKIEKKYQASDPEMKLRFYTLGLGVGNNALAESVLDPAINDHNNRWNSFEGTASGSSFGIDRWNNRNKSVTVGDKGFVEDNDSHRDYVDQYFPASNTSGLTAAFEDIVEEIILQSAYYPTHVEGDDVNQSGFLEFRDYIGENMEVKTVKGVALGEELFTGESFARTVKYGMGTVTNPTDVGNQLVWAVMDRLHITDVTVARQLITDAYTHGQLAYHDEDPANITYSNYIGWYADASGKYVGFWDGTEAAFATRPDGAVQAVKSYALLGAVDHPDEDHRDTDMLYASIQVRTNIATGEEIVYGRLPASLIPLIGYDVKLGEGVTDPMAPGASATMTYTAATPSRLLYEVGLDSQIDLLDIAGTAPDKDKLKIEDGKYVFYTNQWEEDYDHTEGDDPSTHHNTFVSFQPSDENERYVYHEDMVVYSDANGTVYRGATAPTSGYRAQVIYVNDAALDQDGNENKIYVKYVPITATMDSNTLEQKQDTQGRTYWVVKKGTIYQYAPRTEVEKEENPTGTLHCSEHPLVHLIPAYHLDAVLGNNGKLTIDPPEGIKLTKQVDETLANTTETFTFTLDADTYEEGEGMNTPVIYEDAKGVRTDGTIDFVSGKATVNLTATQSVYVILPAGVTVTVTENTDGEDYMVKSITEDGEDGDGVVTVTEDKLTKVEVTNTEKLPGHVKIGKTVVSTVADHMSKDFTFTVKIAGYENESVKYSLETLNASTGETETKTGEATLNANGEYDFVLSHNDAITFQELKDGTKVEVTETNIPGGFTTNHTDNKADATIVSNQTAEIGFVNTYDSSDVQVDDRVAINVTKTMTGDDWEDGGSFRFQLQKHTTGDVYEDVGAPVTATFDRNTAAGTAKVLSDLTAIIAGETFTAAGTYGYRVVELIPDAADALPGVIYDHVKCYFRIVVEDNGEGQLVISDVEAGQDATVTKDESQNQWTVDVGFTNVYTISGAADLTITVNKNIENDTGAAVSPAGFAFVLYKADKNFNIVTESEQPVVIATTTTALNGIATFQQNYVGEDAGQTYYYVLKETAGNQPGMTYSEQEYGITVELTDDASNLGMTVTYYAKDGALWTEIGSKSNIPDTPVTVAAPVFAYTESKEVTDPESGAITTETVREISLSCETENAVIFYQIGEDGAATEYVAPFTVAIPEGKDNVVITAWAVIGEGESQQMSAIATAYYIEEEAQASLMVEDILLMADEPAAQSTIVEENIAVSFTNVYDLTSDTAVISGTKTLIGRPLADDEFKFELRQGTVGADGAVSYGPGIETVSNINGAFTFAELTFDQVGTYYYEVVEVAGDLGGVTYDDSVYHVAIEVTDGGNGALNAVVTSMTKDGSNVSAIAFENTYTTESTSAAFQVTKAMTGRKLAQDMFTFELYHAKQDGGIWATEGNAIQTVTNGAPDDSGVGSVDFAAISYTTAGEYTYIIKEQHDGETIHGVTYDDMKVIVTVTVKDNGLGALEANVAYSTINGDAEDDTKFNNSYTVKPPAAPIIINGTKELHGKNLSAGEFTFALYQTDAYFENHEFVSSVPNDADGGFSLTIPESLISQIGGYRFIIKEVTGTDDNITYDGGVYYVLVEVTDNGSGQLVTKTIVGSAQSNGSISHTSDVRFTNYFTPDPETLKISGKKILKGGVLAEDQFTFELYETESDYVVSGAASQSKTNDADGSFEFDLEYKEEGTHYYVLKEQIGTDTSIVYDETEYRFYVTVEQNDLNELVATLHYNGTNEYIFTFTNATEDEVTEKEVFLTSNQTINIDGQKVEPGQTLTYAVEYTNYTGKTVNVEIVDTIPAHTTYVPNTAESSVNGVIGSLGADGETLTWSFPNVAPGATVVAKFQVTVNADADEVVIANEATVKDGENTYTTNEVHNHTDDENPEKDVFAAGTPKVSIDGKQVKAGDELVYEITYLNTSGQDEKVVITDKIPDHTEFLSADNGGSYDRGVITWTFDKVEAWDSVTVTFRVKVSADVPEDQLITNTAAVNGKNTNTVYNHTYEQIPDKDATTTVGTAIIDGSKVEVGDVLTYTIDHVNLTGEKQDITITDRIPAYTELVPDSISDYGKAENGVITWTFSDVEPWDVVDVSFKVKVVGSNVIITNQAEVLEGNNTYKTDEIYHHTVDDPVKDVADAADAHRISIDGEYVRVGQQLLYSITYTNVTEQEETVTITDTIPEHTTYVDGSASAGGVNNRDVITWSDLKVPALSSITVHFVVAVNNETDKVIENQAVVKVGENTYKTNKVTNHTGDEEPDKSVSGTSKSGTAIIDGSEVEHGDTLHYTIGYTNTTGATIKTLTIVDTIPAYTTLESSSIINGNFNKETGEITWTFSNVKNNERVEVSFEVVVNVPNGESAVIQNSAKVLEGTNTHHTNVVTNYTGDPVEKDVFDAEATVPGISIDGQKVDVGDTLLYTVSYTNQSTGIVDVTIEDSIPKYTQYVPGSADNQNVLTIEDGKLKWAIENLPAWETVTVSFQVEVMEPEAVIANTAVVNGENTNTVYNHTDDGKPEKTVSGTSQSGQVIIDGGKVQNGDILTYEIEYVNLTGKPVDEVTIVDTIPAYTELADKNGGKYDKEKGTITWTFENVEPWETKTVSFRVEVVIPEGGETVIPNQAKVYEGKNELTTNEVHNYVDDEEPEKTVYSGSSTVNIDGQKVEVGEVLTYQIEYTNLTNEVKKVSITDYIPEHTTYVEGSADKTGGTLNTQLGAVVWNFEKVQPWETVTVSFQVKVTAPDVFIDNQAVVWDGENKYTNEVTNYTYDEDPVKEVVDVKTQINLDGEIVLPGQEMTYNIEYVNTTGQTVNVTIEDEIPAHTMLVDGSIIGGGVFHNGKITWTFNAVAPQTVINVGFAVTVDADAYGVAVNNTANVTLNNGTVFKTNPVSSRTPAAVTIEGMKSFKDLAGKDKEFDAGDFSFELYQGETLIETVKNDADGKFAFQTLKFDNVGAYHYTVKEVKGGLADVIYDTTEYAVTVEVSKKDDFALTATTTVKTVASNEAVGQITFTNREKEPEPVYPNPIKVELDVLKELKNYTNQKIDLSKFRFELYDADNDRVQKVLPANSKGKVTFTLNFDHTDAGEDFHFILSEVDTEIPGVTYSTKAYKISIKISESNEKLVAAVWVDGERVDLNEFVFKFTNVLRDPSEPWEPKDDNVSPDTGDEGTFRWIALMTIGCVGFLLTLIRSLTRKRQRR